MAKEKTKTTKHKNEQSKNTWNAMSKSKSV